MSNLATAVQQFRAGSCSFAMGLTVAVCLLFFAGCNSILNSWLDPTTLGVFDHTATLEIRASLTLEDAPFGVPGSINPSPEDLVVHPKEYPITAGDTLAIEIHELRQRQIPFQAQAVVSSTGFVNLPVLGRIRATGLTVPEFENSLVDALRVSEILVNPEVNVNPMFLQKATYSIFGVGVSASNDAPLRAGTFPIRRPDLRLLEAINLVGGLNEFVTDIYIFRYDDPNLDQPSASKSEPAVDTLNSTTADADQVPTEGEEPSSSESAEQQVLEAVLAGEPGEPIGALSEESTSDQAVPELLEPTALQPYIWVNEEFVENPSYQPAAVAGASSFEPSSSIETVTPAVNWARIAGDTSFRIIRVPADLLRSGDPEVNLVVRAGDVIRILSGEIGVYYVMGQVNRVGTFPFNTEPVTLKAAIAAAGGLSSLAWPDRCTVYRRLGQREQMIQVDLDRIFAGKDADFYIKRGDIINVGTHPFAPFLQRIRALTLPTPVTNVGYSFTYARNFADIDSFSSKRNPANEPSRFPALFP